MLQATPRTEGTGYARYLLRSALFLAVLAALAAYYHRPLIDAFRANPGLNGIILGILAFGILYTLNSLLSVFLLSRATGRAMMLVEQVQKGRRPLPQATEVLLSPSQRGLGDFLRTVHRVLQQGQGTSTLPYLLDSLAARGEDRRALVRYLTGALVLLGLIGTFFGLLVTIDGVREVLGNLAGDPEAETMELLTGLRERLAVPLRGMGLAFSSSLFGLLASLVLAFVELQLFHAQNDFHARLETMVVSDLVPLWQSGGSRSIRDENEPASPYYVEALLDTVSERLDRVAGIMESQTKRDLGVDRLSEQVVNLGERIESLRTTLDTLERDRTAELRNELRLLSRTLSKDKLSNAPED